MKPIHHNARLSKPARYLLGALLFFSGAANLIDAVIPKGQTVVDWMEQWVPFEVSQGSRLLIFFFGLVQIVVSRGLFRGKRSAWMVASAALSFTVILHLGRAWDWEHSACSLALLGVLLWNRHDFKAASDASSSFLGFLIGGASMAALMVYAYSTVWHYAPEARLRRDPDVVFRAASGLILFQSIAAEGHHSKKAQRAFQGVQLGSLLVLLGTLALVLRPVLGSRIKSSEEELAQVGELIARYGRDPMDGFALMNDKRWYFHGSSEGERSVVAFGLWRNYAVALAEPIGPEASRSQAMDSFRDFCNQQDWHASFYCCPETNRPFWESSGWRCIQIAEDARLSLGNFELKGGAFQSLRTNLNHARKESWSFRWYDGGQIDHGLEAQMKVLSDGWIAARGGTEMGFDLGTFSLLEIRRLGAACVLDDDGRLLAFATWPAYERGKGRVIDLMRSAEGIRGAMDFLILESIARFKAEGVEEVSLGNAPLARVTAEGEKSGPGDHVVKYLFDHLNRIYGYKPLFEFKKKYHPDWRGRWLVYERHSDLPSLAAALVRLHAPRGLFQLLRS